MISRTHSFGNWRRVAVAAILLGIVIPGVCQAGKLVIKIRVANPAASQRSIPIRSNLPAGVATNDILNAAGLKLGYDVKADTYFLHDTLVLQSKEVVFREIEVRDVWQISEDDVEALGGQVVRLASMLGASRYADLGIEGRAKGEELVVAIVASQRANAISKVSPVEHIAAYEADQIRVGELRKAVGVLENYVLATGQNPGDELVGDDPSAALPRRDAARPEEYGTAIYRVTVRNTSRSASRPVALKQPLPQEIEINDVLDAGGLIVREDPESGLTCLLHGGVEVEAGGSRTFEVKVRDKWNVNEPRFVHLRGRGEELLGQASGRHNIEAVRSTLEQALEELAVLEVAVGPESLSAEYIAFHRTQARALDEIERRLNRVEAALKPLFPRVGFDFRAPDRKTTWLVIYSILGFLALLSLLFFGRWFGKSSD